METQFLEMGLNALRVDAIYGKDVIDEKPHSYAGLKLSAGEIGCALSHLKALQEIVDGDEPYGAVFEDDIRFSSDAADFLRDFSWIPEHVHLVKLDTSDPPVLTTSPYQMVCSDRQLLRCHTGLSGAAGYIVSRVCAATLLKRPNLLNKPIDISIYDPRFRIDKHETPWQMFPAICVQQCRDDETAFLAEDISIIDQTRIGFRKSLANTTKREPRIEHWKRRISRPYKQARRQFLKFRLRLFQFWAAGKWVKIKFED